MASTSSSDARSRLRTAGRSALEGAAAVAAAAVLLRGVLEERSFGPALGGLSAAWAASSISVTLLIFARPRSFETFLKAFGGGVLLRAAVLAGLMVWSRGRGWAAQAPILGAYALGVLFLLLLEYRHLMGRKRWTS